MSALAPAPSCASTWSDNGLREGCAPGRTRFHWNSVSLSRTSWPSVSFFTVSRWSRRAKGSQVCGEARCAGMIVTLARARCSTLTGAGSAGGAAKARSRRNMNHACRASPFCELAHWFNLNPSPDGLPGGALGEMVHCRSKTSAPVIAMARFTQFEDLGLGELGQKGDGTIRGGL